MLFFRIMWLCPRPETYREILNMLPGLMVFVLFFFVDSFSWALYGVIIDLQLMCITLQIECRYRTARAREMNWFVHFVYYVNVLFVNNIVYKRIVFKLWHCWRFYCKSLYSGISLTGSHPPTSLAAHKAFCVTQATHDRGQTLADTNSSPWAYASGELKKKQKTK